MLLGDIILPVRGGEYCTEQNGNVYEMGIVGDVTTVPDVVV
jgi:hypothetical protein